MADFDAYSFDPEAGREGAFTFLRPDGTSRTVANTPYAARLAADIDARKSTSADVGATASNPFGASPPLPDPTAGIARAERAAAARVAPEFRDAQAALSGSAPLPDLDAFAARMNALDAARRAPRPQTDPGAGLSPEAAEAARAIGTAPPRIDTDALAARLSSIGQPRPAPALSPAPAPVAMGAPEDVMVAETGYRRQGPFDMRRFAVDGAPADGGAMPWYEKPLPQLLGGLPVVRDIAQAARNTARVNFGVGAQAPSAPQTTPPLATPVANTGPDAEAQLLASQTSPPEPFTSEPGPMASVAPPAVSQAPAMSVAPPSAPAQAQQPALPPSAVSVGRTANPTMSVGQRIDAQIDRQMAPQFALTRRQGDLATQSAEGDASFAQDEAVIGRERDQADEQRRAQQARDEARLYGDVTRAADEVTAKQYDPDRYFKQRGAGATLLASLAVAMGELGRGLQRTGGPNTALQIVNDAVERDVAAQREEYARAKDKLQLKNNAYAQLRQRGLDDESAASQARAGALGALATRAKAFRAGMRTDQARLDADAAVQALTDKTDSEKAKARQQMANDAAAQAAAQARGQRNEVKERLAEAKTAAEIEKLQAEAGKARSEGVGMAVPDGYGGVVPVVDKDMARDLQKKAALTARALANLDTIERTTGPMSALSPADRSARAAAISFFGKNFESLQDQGVFREDDRRLYEEQIAPGNFSPATKQIVQNLKRSAAGLYRDKVAAATGGGLAPAFSTVPPESARKVGE